MKRFAILLKRFNSVLKQGVLLGYFDGSGLQEATCRYYEHQMQYQNEAYNLSGLQPWETKAIRKHFPLNSRFIVAGAGGGREAIALSKKGIEITAFDCSKNLVHSARELASRKNLNLCLTVAEPDFIPPLAGLWDGAIVGWGAYMHIPSKDKRIHFLNQLRTKLSPESPILLSFFTRRPSSKKFRIIYYLASVIRFIRQSKYKVELGDTLDGSFDHYFTENEIKEELGKAGFQTLFFAEQPYGHAVAFTQKN